MLTEQGVGDAYCLAWEFAPNQKGANDLATYHVNPNYPEFPAGHYSDDTMRAIANSIVVLGDPKHWFDPAAYAGEYQAAHARDDRLGWSKGFQAYLEASRDKTPEQFMLGLRRRATNGAVMGVAPLGFLPDEATVRMAAAAQTISTHSGAAISSAQTIALAAHYLLHRKGDLDGLVDYLKDEVDWGSKQEAGDILGPTSVVPIPGMPAWTIASNAIYLLTRSDLFGLSDRISAIVDQAKTSNSDADSIAAVTMALGSCSTEIAQDLPNILVEGLENEPARAMLAGVDHALHAFAGTKPIRTS
jgi:ADP-ribosyl-[dinitrogen reductase] hydrolase